MRRKHIHMCIGSFYVAYHNRAVSVRALKRQRHSSNLTVDSEYLGRTGMDWSDFFLLQHRRSKSRLISSTSGGLPRRTRDETADTEPFAPSRKWPLRSATCTSPGPPVPPSLTCPFSSQTPILGKSTLWDIECQQQCFSFDLKLVISTGDVIFAFPSFLRVFCLHGRNDPCKKRKNTSNVSSEMEPGPKLSYAYRSDSLNSDPSHVGFIKIWFGSLVQSRPEFLLFARSPAKQGQEQRPRQKKWIL